MQAVALPVHDLEAPVRKVIFNTNFIRSVRVGMWDELKKEEWSVEVTFSDGHSEVVGPMTEEQALDTFDDIRRAMNV